MESRNTQEDAPVRLKSPGNSRSMCLDYIKLIDDNDPIIIKCVTNHAHEYALYNTTLSLSWSENKHKNMVKQTEIIKLCKQFAILQTTTVIQKT